MMSSKDVNLFKYSALDVIRNEHQAMAAVLDALAYTVRNIASGRLTPDFVLLASMVDYMAEMPDKLHHPKEDRIFAVVREKTCELDAYLEPLERNHKNAVALTATMDRGLVHYLRGGKGSFDGFRDAVEKYVKDEYEHMRSEERHIFAFARRNLSEEDWREINEDFARNCDPWTGMSDDFVDLFQQIANLTPHPAGLKYGRRDGGCDV